MQGVDPSRCCVVEDSKIGLQASKAAGMTCFVTKSSYTQDEDFTGADGVYDCIGEGADTRFTLRDFADALAAAQRVGSRG